MTALVLPVLLFLWLKARGRLSGRVAAAIAVASGWALNVAYAYRVRSAASASEIAQTEGFVGIAALFGWACPTVLVLLTWLIWHLATKRKRTGAA
ncbi:hypothetical protein LVB77_09485 [Lysobacter sp. 5GHs7-4]|uniref:hypothetical protein n=1 Tax=Lysobacter sp. 5GHs7-4 TaxID=2904253 RepID=UPI001E5E6F61|nr:hypothetical protein [Lysobacter sp. 5GHs7-4]UHQ24882.1 hypothetical protein LVB77_09485 [Lysobacter sp. 5GHs7-4]